MDEASHAGRGEMVGGAAAAAPVWSRRGGIIVQRAGRSCISICETASRRGNGRCGVSRLPRNSQSDLECLLFAYLHGEVVVLFIERLSTERVRVLARANNPADV